MADNDSEPGCSNMDVENNNPSDSGSSSDSRMADNDSEPGGSNMDVENNNPSDSGPSSDSRMADNDSEPGCSNMDVENNNISDSSSSSGTDTTGTAKFYPLRTVLFHPVYESFDLVTVENFVSVFGSVSKKKFFFNGNVGCLVVEYKTFGGTISALLGMEEVHRRLPSASYFKARILWKLMDFIEADRDCATYVSVRRSSAREERVILVPFTFFVTEEVLPDHLKLFGAVESIQVLDSRPDLPADSYSELAKRRKLTSALVTFTDPLDAVVSVICTFDLNIDAMIRISDPDELFLYMEPLDSNIKISAKPVPDDFQFLTVYEVLSNHFETDLFRFRSPRKFFTAFNRFVEPGILPAMRLAVLDSVVSSLVLATARGSSPLEYYELDFHLKSVVTEGISLPKKLFKKKRRWASYFFLDLEKIYFDETPNNSSRFTFKVEFRDMNHVFPKLYPQFFEKHEWDFYPATPMRCTFQKISSGLSRARMYHLYAAEACGKRTSQYSKPYLCILDPVNKLEGAARNVWHIPIIVHSENMPY